MTSQNYAEWYLTSNNGANAVTTTTCSGTVAASATANMVCLNVIPTTVAQTNTWGAAFTYSPPGMSTSPGQGAYIQLPQFYISYLGSAGSGTSYNSVTGQNQTLFQIDAAGWAGSSQTTAVVESAYKVLSISTSIPPSSTNVIQKDVSLGGP
jgi:Tfp pilus assembly protein PilX